MSPPESISPASGQTPRLGARGRQRLRTIAVLAAIAFLAIIVTTGTRLWRTGRTVAAATAQSAVPFVRVTHPQLPETAERLELPGTLSASLESPIYARTSGYLAHLHADIGQRVRRGDLLAEIETPEVDQELAQAQAELEQTKASRDLARLTADRWRELRAQKLVAQQDADEKQAALVQLEANVRAAAANVNRLRQMQAFKRVTAPFDGVITVRNVDIGTLIDAGAAAANRQIFTIAQTDPLRLFVNVPQSDAPAVKAGLDAWVELTEFPGRKFTGKVARTAGAIDPKARTLLTQIEIPNRDGALLPGAYGRVFIAISVRGAGVRVPVASALFRADGPHLAIVKPDDTIELRAITVGRNTGTMLEVPTGLSAEDRIVLNPGDSLDQGQRVQVR